MPVDAVSHRMKSFASNSPEEFLRQAMITFAEDVSAIEAELRALRKVADAAKRFGDAYWDEEGAATAFMAMEEALKAAGR